MPMPSDIDPKSGSRLPLPNRDDLDEAGKKAYDRGTTPGATIAGLQGPAGVQLFSPKTAAHVAALNKYLRFEAGFTPHVREVAILKSMGAPSSMVARIFLIGGTTVGLLGTSLGIGYGLLVCLLARLYGYPLDPKVYLIGELPVQIRPEELVGVALATMAIAWVATLYPALRASRMGAVDGLRYT